MESLLGVLLILVVLGVGIALLALPFLLLSWLLKQTPTGRTPMSRTAEWTDDDEIAARNHH